MDLSEELRVIKDIWDCKNVVDGDKIDRIGPRNEENEPAVEMNTLCRDTSLGGPLDLPEELRVIKDIWDCKNVVDGDKSIE